jgi:sugar phosphate isomerase/epimerase
MKMTRRQALGTGLAAAGIVAENSHAAVSPKKPSTGAGEITSQLKLSCAAYSLRDYLPHDGKPGKMTLSDYLDLAAVWRLDGVELTAYYFTSEDPKAMYELKAKAFKLGLDVSGSAVGNNFCVPPGDERTKQIEYVKKWVDHAVELGTPCLRVFAGHKPKDGDRKRDCAWVVECLKPCCDYAGTRGVFLALENHGYLTETGPDILGILDAVNHEWLGVNLDTGNFTEDPYKNIELVAPKTITLHTKTELRTTDGKGTEPADFARIMRILRDANYRGYISLEYEAKEDAMTAVPNCLAKIREAMNA